MRAAPDSSPDVITEAAQLVVGNAGAAERLLALHHPGRDSRCVGCGHAMIRWPCVIVMIARQAQEIACGRR